MGAPKWPPNPQTFDDWRSDASARRPSTNAGTIGAASYPVVRIR